MSFFNNIRANGDSDARVPANRQAEDFLNGAARTRDSVTSIERDRLTQARDSGGISLALGTTDSEIDNYASKVGFHNQATSIVHNVPTSQAFAYMARTMETAQHSKGATHTEKYGDMRTYGGALAAKQRGSNTRLTNPNSLHDTAENEEERQMEEARRRSYEDNMPAGNFDQQQLAMATQASLKQQQFQIQQQFQSQNQHMTTTMMGMHPPTPAVAT